MANFKHHISYKCKSKEEQDEIIKFLKDKGFSYFGAIAFYKWPYVITQYGAECGFGNHNYPCDRKLIENKDLFLALACCTNEEYGIKGEWWKCVKEMRGIFTKDKFYQAHTSLNKPSAFIDDNGSKNGMHDDNLLYFTKATKEEIVNMFEQKTVISMTQTITQEKLFYYLEQAHKHKPKLVDVLKEQFPNIWEKEFVVTKNFYDFVVKEIGNCKEWQTKLNEDFSKFNVPKYNIEKGELCFVSDDPNTKWEILKFSFYKEGSYKFQMNQLDFHNYGSYKYCIPMKEVKAPYQIPEKGVHY